MPNISRVMCSENHSNQSRSSSGRKSQNKEMALNLKIKVIPACVCSLMNHCPTTKKIYQFGLENEEALACHQC